MLLRTLTPLLAATAAAFPAAAAAAPPWSPPATIAGATGAAPETLFTAAGHGVVLSGGASRSPRAVSQLATITAAGTVVSTQPLDYVASALGTYARDHVVVAGASVARSGDAGTVDDASSIVVRFGVPGALGTEHVVAGSKGQQLYGLASNRDGLMALVTGAPRSRTVFLRRPGSSTFRLALRIAVSNLARDAAVAVGEDGDVLVAYEDRHEIRARHIGTRGGVGAVHRIGSGVQSTLQPVVNDDRRLAVAWKSQRVNEGESTTPASVWFATAAPGHGFGRARRIATASVADAEQFLPGPGVRLIANGNDALLAYTGSDGRAFTVNAAQVTAGHVAPSQRLSPAGVAAALGDAALDANGAQVVAWRSGVSSRDGAGQPAHTPALANVRARGASSFGAAEAITPADADVDSPSAAIDPVSGVAIVAFGFLVPPVVQLSVRAAS